MGMFDTAKNYLTESPWGPTGPSRGMLFLGGGMLGAGLGGLFGKYKNPAGAASPYLDQARRDLPQYYQPYIQAGQDQLPSLEQGYSSMTDPNAFLKQIGSGYQASPGYEWMKNQGLQATQNAAAAGGMLGSLQHERESAEMVTGLANQDFYNYLQKALGTYGAGLQGKQGLYDTSFGASTGLGENLSSLLGAQAGLGYEGQNAQNQHQSGGLGGLLGGIGSFLPFLL